MKKFGLIFMLSCVVTLSSQQHRVAPGVPPQQYGQQQYQPGGGHPPPPQHMQQQQHQVPMHPQQVGMHPQQHQQVQHQVPMHQQVPVQHQVPMQQQVPVQHQQPHPGQPNMVQTPPQQQFVQGQPVEQPHHIQGHNPHHPAAGQQLLNMAHLNQEKDHIKEHMEVPIDTSNMSEQELQFHYFKMHDADNNNKLDGCELIKSLIHWHANHKDESGNRSEEEGKDPEVFTDENINSILEPVFSVADKNNDGYLDYIEYIEHSGVRLDTTHSRH